MRLRTVLRYTVLRTSGYSNIANNLTVEKYDVYGVSLIPGTYYARCMMLVFKFV